MHEDVKIGSIDSKTKKDAKELSGIVNISELEALLLVLQFDNMGISGDEDPQIYYVRHYLSERRYIVKLVGLILALRGNGQAEGISISPLIELCRRHSTDLLAEPDFITNIIHHIDITFKQNSFTDADDDTLANMIAIEVGGYRGLLRWMR